MENLYELTQGLVYNLLRPPGQAVTVDESASPPYTCPPSFSFEFVRDKRLVFLSRFM